MYETLALLAGFALIYSSIAGRIERSWITGPIIFVGFGCLVGPMGLGILKISIDQELLKTLAELTLALVLFTDAAGADLGILKRFERLPIRLLLIGLPLTILLGFGFGELLFGGFSWVEIALLATMLAPTDAALGKGVITNPNVPEAVRQGLNVESGLNDGICVPVLLLFLALATGNGGVGEGVVLFGQAIGIGLAVGLGGTLLAALLLGMCNRKGWLTPTWKRVSVITLAFTCFATAQALGGSGFIACFSGGLLFGGLLKKHREEFLLAAEGVGDIFGMLTWVLFGAVVVSYATEFTWPVLLYAVLSLTVIRMLPVFLVLTGLKANAEDKLFVAWFGPRGLASIVFVVLVLDADLPHGKTLASVVAATILLSVVLHGVTANAWARGYGRRAKLREGESSD